MKCFLLCFAMMGFAVQHQYVIAKESDNLQASILFSAEMQLLGRKSDGGYARLASVLSELKQNDRPIFFLFGGNSLGPSPMSTFDSGSHIVDILNSLGPDAMGVTKREYSYFEEQLSLRAYEAAFPMVATNIIDPINMSIQDGLVSSVVISKGDIKLGVLAIVDPDAAQQYLLQRVEILDIKNSIIKEAKKLKDKGANVITVMHAKQFAAIDDLLEEGIIDFSLLKDRYLDLSDNTGLGEFHTYKDPRVILTQPAEVAIVDIFINSDGLIDIQWSKKSLLNQLEDSEVAKQRNDYLRRLDRLMDLPLAKVTESFDTNRKIVRTRENRFGNFVADTLLSFTDADAALINSGIIRGNTEYQLGHTFSRKDLANELPFRTGVVVLDISGRDLINTIESSLSEYELQKGKFPHVANMQIQFNSSNSLGSRLLSLKIAGKEVVEGKLYKLATTDYLFSGGDGYISLKNGKLSKTSAATPALLSDLVMQKIITENRVGSPLSARVVNVNDRG